jgi:crossover junction endodeoxyribonuclease RuvC
VFDIESANGRILAGRLIREIETWQPKLAVIERVGPMPRQGVSTSWKFARSYGCVEGVVEALGIPSHEITPAVWKRQVGIGKDKAAARAEAERRWPLCREWFARVKDAGRAEAALMVVAFIARQGMQHWQHDTATATGRTQGQ